MPPKQAPQAAGAANPTCGRGHGWGHGRGHRGTAPFVPRPAPDFSNNEAWTVRFDACMAQHPEMTREEAVEFMVGWWDMMQTEMIQAAKQEQADADQEQPQQREDEEAPPTTPSPPPSPPGATRRLRSRANCAPLVSPLQ